jgi:hypothetical protein
LPNQIRTIKACIDESEQVERQRSRPCRRPTLPSPRPAALAIAVTIMEVRKGVRSPWHLERVSHYSLWPLWDTLAEPTEDHPNGTAARPLRLTLEEHTPGLVHATIVLEYAGTIEPIALALDGAHGRWELIELEYARPTPRDIPPLTRDLPAAPSGHRPRPARTLNGQHDIPLGLPQRLEPNPAWRPQLLDTRAIDLE